MWVESFNILYYLVLPVELSISHNNELEEIGILFSMDFSAIFPIQIVNNSRLDASLLCENNNYAAFDVIYVHKNLKDCGTFFCKYFDVLSNLSNILKPFQSIMNLTVTNYRNILKK